ncbi:urea amidolyase associated protein UAAP2 [Methyloligella solikamskensis]|uniref:Urea amidolyase associated protein UAAP2 n=1 Tax=Methyloligella solikamskensis TaxID=1177756 RepID=A0ABW3JD34_9HYPH
MTEAMPRDPSTAKYDVTHPERMPWWHIVKKGEVLRIVDLGGCQAVDTLIYDAYDHEDRYDHQQTILAQKNIFITTGTKLYSTEGEPLMTVIEDTVGNHDTLGGACSAESNTVRFGHDKKHMHNCRDNFLHAAAENGMHKADITCNINLFMNVPVEPNGHLAIVDGVSDPGSHIDLKAERDVLVMISNCPQVNNPCNGYNPTPIRLIVWDE